MTVSEAVAQRIFELCDARNITVNKLCTISSVTQSTINDIVNGKSKNPGIGTINKLCDGLSITLKDFFDTELFCNIE